MDAATPVDSDFMDCSLCLGLLEKIPRKIQRALNLFPIRLRCLDVAEQLIVVGVELTPLEVFEGTVRPDMGALFVYTRRLAKSTRIKTKDGVGSVQLHLGEYASIAAGLNNGVVALYQLPSSEPGMNRKMAEYDSKLHDRAVTSLEWSRDGSKVVSGDAGGLVVLTFVDFDNNSFSSSFVCQENSLVSQSSLRANVVAISTHHRALLCYLDRNNETVQIGTAPRKGIGNYGAQFEPVGQQPQPQPDGLPILYTTRPGCRLWKANLEGHVLETIIYKDHIYDAPVLHAHFPGQIIPVDSRAGFDRSAASSPAPEVGFGPLLFLTGDLVVTHGEYELYILDPRQHKVVMRTIFPAPILGMSLCSSTREIFILSANSAIWRISKYFSEELGSLSYKVPLISSPGEGNGILNSVMVSNVKSSFFNRVKRAKASVYSSSLANRSRKVTNYLRDTSRPGSVSSAGIGSSDLPSPSSASGEDRFSSLAFFGQYSPSRTIERMGDRGDCSLEMSQNSFPPNDIRDGKNNSYYNDHSDANNNNDGPLPTGQGFRIAQELLSPFGDVIDNPSVRYLIDRIVPPTPAPDQPIVKNATLDGVVPLVTLETSDGAVEPVADVIVLKPANRRNRLAAVKSPGSNHQSPSSINSPAQLRRVPTGKDSSDWTADPAGAPVKYEDLDHVNAADSPVSVMGGTVVKNGPITRVGNSFSRRINVGEAVVAERDFLEGFLEEHFLKPTISTAETAKAFDRIVLDNLEIKGLSSEPTDGLGYGLGSNDRINRVVEKKVQLEDSDNLDKFINSAHSIEMLSPVLGLDVSNHRFSWSRLKSKSFAARLERDYSEIPEKWSVEHIRKFTQSQNCLSTIPVEELQLILENHSTIPEILGRFKLDSKRISLRLKNLNFINSLKHRSSRVLKIPVITRRTSKTYLTEDTSADELKFIGNDGVSNTKFVKSKSKIPSSKPQSSNSRIPSVLPIIFDRTDDKYISKVANCDLDSIQSVGDERKDVDRMLVTDENCEINLLKHSDVTLPAGNLKISGVGSKDLADYSKPLTSRILVNQVDDSRSGLAVGDQVLSDLTNTESYSNRGGKIRVDDHKSNDLPGLGNACSNFESKLGNDVKGGKLISTHGETDSKSHVSPRFPATDILEDSSKSPEKQDYSDVLRRGWEHSANRFNTARVAVAPLLPTVDQMRRESIISEFSVDESVSSAMDHLVLSRGDSQTKPPELGLDIWCQHTAEHTVTSVAACRNYVAFADSRQYLWYSYLRSPELQWVCAAEPADAIALSPNGKLVWRVSAGTAYALVKPHSKKPRGKKWVLAAQDVISVSVNNHTAWCVRQNGQVSVQTNLSWDRPTSKAESIESPCRLVQISCSADSVWGLTDEGAFLVRVGIKPENPIGQDWVEVFPEHVSGRFVHLNLFDNTCWAVDTASRLWFCEGLCAHWPVGRSGKWWQVMIPTMHDKFSNFLVGLVTPYQSLPPCVFASQAGLWLAVGSKLYYTRSSLTGHRWKHPFPQEIANVSRFTELCASSLYDPYTDYLWLVRSGAEVFGYQPKYKSLQSLAPCSSAKIASLGACPGVLWVLDVDGNLFIRSGVEPGHTPMGLDWSQVSMRQFGDQTKLINISCSLDLVWAVDGLGNIYVRLGTAPTPKSELTPAWIPLDVPSPEDPARSVWTCSDGSIVWLVTQAGRVFCRSGISDGLPIGSSWVEVEGLLCKALAVGYSSVWAVTGELTIFRRVNVLAQNPMGDYWKQVPGETKYLSVTPTQLLWGLDSEGRVLQHSAKLYYTPVGTAADEDDRDPAEQKDWEVL